MIVLFKTVLELSYWCMSSLSLILKLFCDSDLLGEESLDRYNEPLNKPMGKGLETLTLDLGIRVGTML